MGLFDFGMGRRGGSYGYGEGYGQRRGGFNMRWLIALAIAGIGLITYFSRTQINPVTGEKQRVAMSVDQEKALGLQAAPQMAKQMGGVLDPRTNPDAKLVAEVGHKLVNQTEATKSPYVGNFNFYLLEDSKTINAFALPGGQIFITRGLFNKLEDESQLAGVLGHEVGHVIHRHSAEHMAKGQLGQMLVGAVAVGASEDARKGAMAGMAAAMANQMVQLKYGRDDETESDTYGLKLMEQAGYDPRGMLAVMQVLKEAGGGGRQPEFMLSHPLPDNRLQEIKQVIAQRYPDGVPSTLTRGRELRGDPQLAGQRDNRQIEVERRDTRRAPAEERW
jgi:predicted Zn-dependent protease